MSDQTAMEILESAWAARRQALELPEIEQRSALASVRAEIHRAMGMLEGTDRVVQYAHALHFGAHVAMDLGDMDGAGDRWTEAVELLRSSDEPLQLAHKVRHLGDLEMARGHLDEADRHYGEALALYREHSDQGGLDFANLMRRRAILAQRRGEAPEARAAWVEARALYADLGVSEGVAEADAELAGLEG